MHSLVTRNTAVNGGRVGCGDHQEGQVDGSVGGRTTPSLCLLLTVAGHQLLVRYLLLVIYQKNNEIQQ